MADSEQHTMDGPAYAYMCLGMALDRYAAAFIEHGAGSSQVVRAHSGVLGSLALPDFEARRATLLMTEYATEIMRFGGHAEPPRLSKRARLAMDNLWQLMNKQIAIYEPLTPWYKAQHEHGPDSFAAKGWAGAITKPLAADAEAVQKAMGILRNFATEINNAGTTDPEAYGYDIGQAEHKAALALRTLYDEAEANKDGNHNATGTGGHEQEAE